jgi:ABC-type sugar transport system substrate-binding protein
MRSIEDDDIRAMVEASEYYVGGCNENEEQIGRLLMTELHEQGYDKIAIISTAKGDMSGDRREAGMREVADEYGMEIVAEVRGLMQDAEVTAAVESFLAAYPDLDAIVCVASVVRATSAAIKVLEENNSDVKYATVDPPSTDVEYIFASKNFLFTSLVASGAGSMFDYYMGVIKLINAIQGYKITTAAGDIELSSLGYTLTNSYQEVGIAAPVYFNPSFRYFSDDYITQNLLKWNNPALTEESFQEILDTYSLLTMSPFYAH